MARNAISLAAQPPLSYPCSDKLPFNLRTWPGLQTAKIGLNATLVAGTLQFIGRVPKKCSDSRLAKCSSSFTTDKSESWAIGYLLRQKKGPGGLEPGRLRLQRGATSSAPCASRLPATIGAAKI